MKKLSLVCMAALLVMAASCKKEEKNEKFDGGFRAKTETHAGDSKTQLVGQQDVIWSEGDQIVVFSGMSQEGMMFTAEEGGKNDVVFSADVDETFYSQSEFTSVYPTATKSGDNYQIALSATQTYTANGFASGANPMTAHSTNTTLNFKNVCGLLQLNLYSEATTTVKVKDITIYTNADEKLNGNGTLTIADDGIPTLTNLDGGNAITLTCNNVELGKSAEAATPFFFVVPAGTLASGFEVVVTDENDAIWYRKTTSNCTITRSMITSLSPICVVPEICTEVQLWAGGPYWSTCNLGAERPHYYGDFYAWGVSTSTYGDGIATLYDADHRPYQTGTGNETITIRSARAQFGGYHYNKNCPFWISGGQNNAQWSKYNSYPGSLENVDDIAYDLTDGASRIPTVAEFQALLDNTTQQKVSDYHHTGVAGFIFQGKGDYSDKFIFFPFAGDIGYSEYHPYYQYTHECAGEEFACWARELYSAKFNARTLTNVSNHNIVKIADEYYGRWLGISVRPIKNN